MTGWRPVAKGISFSAAILAAAPLLAQAIAPSRGTVNATFVSGSVQIEDGTPPPEPVLIQRLCAAMTRDEAWTDRKGHFSFQVGGGQPLMADASLDASGNNRTGLTQMQAAEGVRMTPDFDSADSLVGCDLRAQMSGYKSEIVHLDAVEGSINRNVGTITLHRMGNVPGLTVSATTMAAPKEAAKLYALGTKEAEKHHFEKARDDLSKAVAEYPNYALAWVALGVVREELHDVTGAIEAYTQARHSDSKLLQPYERLSLLADAAGSWSESAEYTAEWIHLDPVDYPNAYLLNAVASIRLNKLDDAEHSAREGIRLDQANHFPRLHYVLGYVLAARGQLPEAVACFHDYLTLAPNGAQAGTLRQQLPGMEQAAAAQHKP
jgi:tetratricopeptide (TPR) repeat protein